MATSTVPALKASLVGLLEQRPALTGVQVSYGPPLPAPQRESIWVGDVQANEEWATFAAPNQMHENYSVTVIVSVLKEGVSSQSADERCFTLLAELETVIRNDKTLGGVVSSAHLATFRLTEFVSPDGMNRTAQLIVEVDCETWI